MIQIVMMDIKSKRFEWTSCKKPLLLVNGFAYEKQTLAQPNLHLEVQHCYSCDKEHLKSLSQEETGQNQFLIIQGLCYSQFDSLLRAYTLIYHSYFLFMKIDHLYGSIQKNTLKICKTTIVAGHQSVHTLSHGPLLAMKPTPSAKTKQRKTLQFLENFHFWKLPRHSYRATSK